MTFYSISLSSNKCFLFQVNFLISTTSEHLKMWHLLYGVLFIRRSHLFHFSLSKCGGCKGVAFKRGNTVFKNKTVRGEALPNEGRYRCVNLVIRFFMGQFLPGSIFLEVNVSQALGFWQLSTKMCNI